MTTVLVTGYGGFLGAEVSRQLIEAGYSVRGIARRSYPELKRIGVECIQGDLSDAKIIPDAVQGCEAIVHTAAKAGVWGVWDEYYRINTTATESLVRSAVQAGVKAFVHTSSPSVTFAGVNQSGIDESVPYPEKFLCAYPHTKALAEQLVVNESEKGSIRACALRPHLIWGLGDPHLFPRVIDRALAGRLRCVGDGKNLIDVVHVKNAAAAHVAAVQNLTSNDPTANSHCFFLSDGQPIECWQWISRILETARVAVPKAKISYASAYRIGAALETVYKLFRVQSEPPMTRFVAAQLAQDHYFDISKARKLLGYAPETNWDERFAECEQWLQELGGSKQR